MNILIAAVLYAAQIALTLPGYCAKSSPVGLTVYLVHHAIDIFLFWGFLFLRTAAEFAAHIGLVVGVVAHWFINGNQCALTEYMNSLCGKPVTEWFPSLKNMLGLRAISEYFQFAWLGLHVAWDFSRILRP
jgi:hypothetical protein